MRWVDNTGSVWAELTSIFKTYKARRIALNTDKEIAFGGGLHVGEYEALAEELGERWLDLREVNEPMLAVEYIAARVPGQLQFYRDLQETTWALIEEGFSERVITPSVTTTEVTDGHLPITTVRYVLNSHSRTSSGGSARRCFC